MPTSTKLAITWTSLWHPSKNWKKKKYLATREVPHKDMFLNSFQQQGDPRNKVRSLSPSVRQVWFPRRGVKGSQRVFLSSQECYGALELFKRLEAFGHFQVNWPFSIKFSFKAPTVPGVSILPVFGGTCKVWESVQCL